MSPTAAAVCKALDAPLGADREWLLSSTLKPGHPLPATGLIHQLRLLQRGKHPALGLPGGHLTGHDLRRTWASTAVRLDVEGLVVERQLQHSLRRTGLSAAAHVYLVDDMLERRWEAVKLVDAHWANSISKVPSAASAG